MKKQPKVNSNVTVTRNITQHDGVIKKGTSAVVTLVPTWRKDAVQCKLSDGRTVFLPIIVLAGN